MEHELGTIKVEAKIQGETRGKIETFSDVTAKYTGLGEKQKEHLYAVFLDSGNEEIGDKLIGLGGNDSIPVDVQDIVRTASLVNASAVILVHNHPSGIAEATDQDIATTNDIKQALDRLGIHLLDHVIITRNKSYSFRAHSDLQL